MSDRNQIYVVEQSYGPHYIVVCGRAGLPSCFKEAPPPRPPPPSSQLASPTHHPASGECMKKEKISLCAELSEFSTLTHTQTRLRVERKRTATSNLLPDPSRTIRQTKSEKQQEGRFNTFLRPPPVVDSFNKRDLVLTLDVFFVRQNFPKGLGDGG